MGAGEPGISEGHLPRSSSQRERELILPRSRKPIHGTQGREIVGAHSALGLHSGTEGRNATQKRAEHRSAPFFPHELESTPLALVSQAASRGFKGKRLSLSERQTQQALRSNFHFHFREESRQRAEWVSLRAWAEG